MNKKLIKQSIFATIFSTLTIGVLTILTYKTEYGVFLIASFGSTMVLLYGYPESPFAQPKNIFFGHLLTAIVGVFFFKFNPTAFIYFNSNFCGRGCRAYDTIKRNPSSCWG